MAVTDPPPPAVPPLPGAKIVLPPFPETDEKRAGCMKWGLVGCAGLALIGIVGLTFWATRGLDETLGFQQRQTAEAFAPDVTPAEREAFDRAWVAFVARSKKGKVGFDDMNAFQRKRLAALADGRIDAEEARALTADLERLSK